MDKCTIYPTTATTLTMHFAIYTAQCTAEYGGHGQCDAKCNADCTMYNMVDMDRQYGGQCPLDNAMHNVLQVFNLQYSVFHFHLSIQYAIYAIYIQYMQYMQYIQYTIQFSVLHFHSFSQCAAFTALHSHCPIWASRIYKCCANTTYLYYTNIFCTIQMCEFNCYTNTTVCNIHSMQCSV